MSRFMGGVSYQSLLNTYMKTNNFSTIPGKLYLQKLYREPKNEASS